MWCITSIYELFDCDLQRLDMVFHMDQPWIVPIILERIFGWSLMKGHAMLSWKFVSNMLDIWYISITLINCREKKIWSLKGNHAQKQRDTEKTWVFPMHPKISWNWSKSLVNINPLFLRESFAKKSILWLYKL